MNLTIEQLEFLNKELNLTEEELQLILQTLHLRSAMQNRVALQQ